MSSSQQRVSAVPRPKWYRSLYWRIALGFVALLAVVLAVQGLVFLWLTGRVAAAWPGRSASELAAAIAADVAQELTARPDSDLDAFVNKRYSGTFRSFAVVMRDGRTAYSHRVLPPPQIGRAARTRLFGQPNFPAGFGGGRFGGDGRRGRGFGRPPDGQPPDGARRADDGWSRRPDIMLGPPRFDSTMAFEFAVVSMAGNDAGIVAVPVEPPPLSVAMSDLWPTLLTVGVGLLLAATATGALLIFRPAQRRLQALQQAARAVGSGELGSRAPVTGGDEVTTVATAFNEMAGQLEQRTNALQSADRARRQLLADVSHELTTPLAAVRGYVETLAMPDLELDAETRARYLRIVADETDRLEHIVGDLLDIARLEGGGGAFNFESVPVAQLFERVGSRHGRLLEQKRIRLALTQSPDDLYVCVDPNRFEQALQNLAANALRHTPEGGTIAFSAFRADANTHVIIEDSGPGIPPEHMDRVFDRFYKVDLSRTGTPVPSGSGLGLSIVRAIVERHGGAISVGNAGSGGARFEIVLPDRSSC
jgi:signal transduction histidine kinase